MLAYSVRRPAGGLRIDIVDKAKNRAKMGKFIVEKGGAIV
jgi:hypothetical protein